MSYYLILCILYILLRNELCRNLLDILSVVPQGRLRLARVSLNLLSNFILIYIYYNEIIGEAYNLVKLLIFYQKLRPFHAQLYDFPVFSRAACTIL